MTKKDYVLLAEEIKSGLENKKDLRDFVLSLVLSLRVDNIRFDDDKFYKACGLN